MSTPSLTVSPPTAPSVRPGRSWWLLLGGLVLVAVSELVAPHQELVADADAAARAQFIVENDGRLLASYVISFLAAPLIAVMFVRIGCLPPARGRVMGKVAAALGALAAAGLAGSRAVEMMVRDLYLSDPGLAPAVEDAGEHGVTGAVVFLALLAGMMLALIALSVAAARAGWAPWWVVGLAVLAWLPDFFPAFPYKTVLWAVLAASVVGFALAGARRAVQDDVVR